MKRETFLLAVSFLAATPAIFSQKPVMYPGATAQRPDSKYYLTTDSYEKVRAFYVDIYGEPDYQTEKTATFFYEETIFEPADIHLYNALSEGKGDILLTIPVPIEKVWRDEQDTPTGPESRIFTCRVNGWIGGTPRDE